MGLEFGLLLQSEVKYAVEAAQTRRAMRLTADFGHRQIEAYGGNDCVVMSRIGPAQA